MSTAPNPLTAPAPAFLRPTVRVLPASGLSGGRRIEGGTRRRDTPSNTTETSHPFQVWSGILSPYHVRRIGSAIWVFLWLIRRTTAERNGEGLVLGGTPIAAKRISDELGISVETVKRSLACLSHGGYVTTERKQRGISITVAKSKRRRNSTTLRSVISDLSGDSRSVKCDLSRSVKNDLSDAPEVSKMSKSCPQPMTNQRDTSRRSSKREIAVEERSKSAATYTSFKPEDFEEKLDPAWPAIGAEESFGPRPFRKAWEATYAARKIGERVSATMERCIVRLQDTRRTVPRNFYELKRGVERQESQPARPAASRMPSPADIVPRER